MTNQRDSRSLGAKQSTPGNARAPATGRGYSSTAKSLHWLIVLLVLAQFVIAVLMPGIKSDTVPGTLINLHFSLGIVILVVMAIRFILRLLDPVPLDMPDSPGWERRSARATHVAFYFILLVGPFLGWASASAHRLTVNVFGLVSLPDIAAPKARWGLTAGDVHSYMMWTLLALIGLHAAAALYHYFFRHDGVLQRMLPVRVI
jgi:cytochrome b561